jgi:hypothetical protein
VAVPPAGRLAGTAPPARVKLVNPSVARPTPPAARTAASSSGGRLASPARTGPRTHRRRGQRSAVQPSRTAASASRAAQRTSVNPTVVSSVSHGFGPGSPTVRARTQRATTARLTAVAASSRRRVGATSSPTARPTWATPAAANPSPYARLTRSCAGTTARHTAAPPRLNPTPPSSSGPRPRWPSGGEVAGVTVGWAAGWRPRRSRPGPPPAGPGPG